MTALADEQEGDALSIPADPSLPFGADALPWPGIAISDWQLERAYHCFLDHYGLTSDDQGSLVERITKAYALLCDRTRWAITETAVELEGSAGSRYLVTPGFCRGPQWFNKRRKQITSACKGASSAADGVCYHMYAAEMLRLAQLLAEPAPPAIASLPLAVAPPELPSDAECDGAGAPSELTRVEVSGRTLLALCGYIHLACPSHEQVTAIFGADSLSLACDATFASAPALPTALVVCTLHTEEFRELWSAVRPNAREIPSLTLAVLQHGPGDSGLLTVTGGVIDLAVAVRLSLA